MFHLQKGDAIAVFSPSSPATCTAKSRYLRGKKFFEDRGFRIIEGSLTGKSDFYRSGSIAQRADELNDLIRNPDVKCIMSAIGGYNSNALLPYIDYEAFRQNPKIIIGYSDVTALLLGIYAKTGIPTFYGPAVVASFGEFPPFVDDTFDYFSDIFCKELRFPHTFPTPSHWTDEFLDWNTQSVSKTAVKNELITVVGGKVTGRLIGGNLSTMSGIWGSPYMPAINEGDILLIEDCLDNAQRLERRFAHLHINGVFDRVGGIILGKHEKYDDLGTGRQPYDMMMEVIGKTNIPILAEFDCCHTHPMLTMPIGAMVELDASVQTVRMMSFT